MHAQARPSTRRLSGYRTAGWTWAWTAERCTSLRWLTASFEGLHARTERCLQHHALPRRPSRDDLAHATVLEGFSGHSRFLSGERSDLCLDIAKVLFGNVSSCLLIISLNCTQERNPVSPPTRSCKLQVKRLLDEASSGSGRPA
jgi:hypothetical protein